MLHLSWTFSLFFKINFNALLVTNFCHFSFSPIHFLFNLWNCEKNNFIFQRLTWRLITKLLNMCMQRFYIVQMMMLSQLTCGCGWEKRWKITILCPGSGSEREQNEEHYFLYFSVLFSFVCCVLIHVNIKHLLPVHLLWMALNEEENDESVWSLFAWMNWIVTFLFYCMWEMLFWLTTMNNKRHTNFKIAHNFMQDKMN